MNRRKPQNRPKPPPRAEAREPRAARPGLRAWREQHLYSFFSSLGRLAARPWATALTVFVIALALTLPLLLQLALLNAQQLRGDVRDAGAISAFAKPHLDAAALDALVQRIRTRADVATVAVRTPAQGLEEFRSRSGFADALAVLGENPLPAVLVVAPAAVARHAPDALLAALRADPGIDLVQYDAAWRQRLDAILGVAARAVAVLAVLLALALLLVVGNTVRLDILGRADEIGVMQLLGASNAFVRRPFLYVGLWYGALSALLALALAAAAQFALAAPLQRLAASYGSEFVLRGIGWRGAVATLLAGAALGWLGAFAAASRHLWRRIS